MHTAVSQRGRLARHFARVASAALLAAAFALSGCSDADMAFSAPDDPTEDTWAILAVAVSGPDHPRVAESYAEALKRTRGLRAAGVRVVKDGQQSRVYYGRYKRTYDVASDRTSYRPDYRGDLELIRSLRGAGGDAPFRLAMIDLLPAAPGAHPEWALTGKNGYWTLHVAVFYDTQSMTGRRKAAEDYCALLRSQGKEAYYHHGPAKSSVCIGLFPREAVADAQTRDPRTGRDRVESEIVDAALNALQREFPHSLENGHTVSRIVRDAEGKVVERLPNESFVVQVPREGGAGLP
ncbi:MAG: hypothetical protein CHACPFDD_02989 [Phycisphaerae bacterium]|nr:hypothetical protein [Phycisphaerae bacterium]